MLKILACLFVTFVAIPGFAITIIKAIGDDTNHFD